MSSQALWNLPNGRLVRACGIVTLRQQPETANGTIFVSLEDEDGAVQVIVWKRLREGEVRNLIAGHLEDLTPLLGRLATESRFQAMVGTRHRPPESRPMPSAS
jgi:error-prone DNA polymerase